MHVYTVTRFPPNIMIYQYSLLMIEGFLRHFSPFPKQALVYTCLQYKSFENTVGKGEIARKEQFLLFPLVFSTRLKNFLPFSSNLKLSSANSFSSKESKICRLGKG